MNDQPFLSAGPSDMPVDMTRVDRMAATIQKRQTIWTRGKSVALAALGIGAGIGLACFGASFLVQPKIVKTPELIEVPTVYETTKVVEKPVYVDKPVIVHDGPVAQANPPVKVDPPPAPAPSTETHPWNALAGKKYVGILTDVPDGHVCFDHNTSTCVTPVKIDARGNVVTDANGKPIEDPDLDWSPMEKWKGYSVYSAHDPRDPDKVDHYWVADNGTLIHFESAPKGSSHADSVQLTSDGQALNLHVNLGVGAGYTYSFMLDTGASDMTVRQSVAELLVRTGHATWGESRWAVLADGSKKTVKTVTIDRVTVGIHNVDSVVASVAPDSAPMLLGLSVLNRIGRFEVDAPHLTLTFKT